jgi:hypothetical protein
MVVAAISPKHAWKQPILRLADTIVGVAIGVAGAWISLKSGHRRSMAAREMTDTNYEKDTAKTRVCNVDCVVPLCGPRLFPGSARGNSGRAGQSRDGPRPTRPPLRRMGRQANALAGARCKIRFSVRQRFLWNIKSEQKQRLAS